MLPVWPHSRQRHAGVYGRGNACGDAKGLVRQSAFKANLDITISARKSSFPSWSATTHPLPKAGEWPDQRTLSDSFSDGWRNYQKCRLECKILAFGDRVCYDFQGVSILPHDFLSLSPRMTGFRIVRELACLRLCHHSSVREMVNWACWESEEIKSTRHGWKAKFNKLSIRQKASYHYLYPKEGFCAWTPVNRLGNGYLPVEQANLIQSPPYGDYFCQ